MASAVEGIADEVTFATLSPSMLILYLRLLSGEFLAAAQERENNRVYNTPVVILLMILQRLQAGGCMESAVLELPDLPASLWPDPCKRLQSGAKFVSTNTGGYNKARQKLPLKVVQEFCDHAFAELTASTNRTLPAIGRLVYVFDGTTVRTAHTKELKQQYPPTSNQNGESHWPLIRMLVAHDVVTGLGLRPVWGAVNGPNAVSEQRLFELAIDQLPEGAVVVDDANFGVFTVCYAADQRKHPVVSRMTLARARSLLGEPLRDGIDRRVEWKPSKAERKKHPGLPLDACISGRLLVTQVQPSDGGASFLLCLFTTLEDDREVIVDIYGHRWSVETDIKALKCTLRLDHLTCKTTEMMNKEIEIAVMSYNLVRTVMYQAAQRAGLTPREFSFTRVKRLLNLYGPKIAKAKTKKEAETLIERLAHYIGQAKLYKRRKKRPSSPRVVWHRTKPFPARKAAQ